MNTAQILLKNKLIIAAICCLICPFLNAQELHLTNQRGVEYGYKPSLTQRISGVRQIYVFYPKSSAQNDRYVYQNFIVYLRRLGLTVIDRGVAFKPVDASLGGASAYILKCTEDIYQYIEGINVLAVVMNIAHAGKYSSERIVAAYTFVDPVNEFDWTFQFEPEKNAERYIKQCQSSICGSYSYNAAYAYQPSYISSNYTKSVLQSYIDKGKYSSIEGIYEGDDYTLGVKKSADGTYYLLYHGSKKGASNWRDGYVKAVLRESNTAGVYRATWYGRGFQKMDFKIIFEKGLFTTYGEQNEKELYIKMYPTSKMESEKSEKTSSVDEWSGTGFALNDGYIVTNYHVVDGANSIMVHGVNGDYNSGYTASVVATDKTNDLAVIKISDYSFKGFGNIPYAVKNLTLDVGEDVWVLGYPLTQYLGNEIKLTNGLVSSKSGFQGDVATYQISAPVQPGNSGGPMFDAKGDVVGIVNAGVPGAENVGYAIKTSYLKNLIDSYSLSSALPTTNTISSLVLKEQVKRVSGFVFLLICSTRSSSYSSSNSSSNTSMSSKRSSGSSSSYGGSSSTSGKEMSISRGAITLYVGQMDTLFAYNYGPSLEWESDNSLVASVSSKGVVTALSPGMTDIWAWGTGVKRCHVTVKERAASSTSSGDKGSSSIATGASSSSNTINKPQMIDLGLSVKWADRNVGAETSFDFGDFFSWGETTTKEEFKRETYQWFKDDQYTNPGGLFDISGSSYDPAKITLGDSWRMPTEAEIEELITECGWAWTTSNDVQGYMITGKNGNSIFLPSNGVITEDRTPIGSYWSSECNPSAFYYAYVISFDKEKRLCANRLKESFGSIRPVSGSKTLPKTDHKKSDEAYALAVQKYSQYDYSKAYEEVEKSINLHPGGDAYYLKGYIALDLQDYDVAKESFLFCLNNGYRTVESRRNYAMTLGRNSEHEEAIRQFDLVFEEYTKKDSFYVDALYWKALNRAELNDWKGSASDCRTILSYEGKVEYEYAVVYNLLACSYLNLEQVDQAVDPIKKALKLNHNQAIIWDTDGEVQYKKGNYEQCLISMNNAIAIGKANQVEENVNSFLYRGLAKIKLGNLAGGFVDLEKAADLGCVEAAGVLKRIDVANIDFSENGSFRNEIERDITSSFAGDDMKIIGIDLNEEETILYFQYTNTKYETGGWYSIAPDAYIRDKNTGKKYLLLTAQNCALSPYRTPIEKGKTNTFALVFPALPQGTGKIDFVESEDSAWRFYNIELK